MYICGLVIPVPGDKKEDYRRWAKASAAIFKEYGCWHRHGTLLGDYYRRMDQ